MASFIIPILNSTNTFASANALVIENAEIVEYSSTAGGYIESFDGGAKIYINENFENILADGLGATRTLVYK